MNNPFFWKMFSQYVRGEKICIVKTRRTCMYNVQCIMFALFPMQSLNEQPAVIQMFSTKPPQSSSYHLLHIASWLWTVSVSAVTVCAGWINSRHLIFISLFKSQKLNIEFRYLQINMQTLSLCIENTPLLSHLNTLHMKEPNDVFSAL